MQEVHNSKETYGYWIEIRECFPSESPIRISFLQTSHLVIVIFIFQSKEKLVTLAELSAGRR